MTSSLSQHVVHMDVLGAVTVFVQVKKFIKCSGNVSLGIKYQVSINVESGLMRVGIKTEQIAR